MQTWLTGAEDKLRGLQRRGAGGHLASLAEQEADTTKLATDVLAHQADLRFLNMQAQRYIDQAKVKPMTRIHKTFSRDIVKYSLDYLKIV